MNASELRNGVLAAIAEVAPEVDVVDFKGNAPLRRQVDLDSMDWLNVIVGWSRRFGIEIPEADYRRLSTLDAVVAYLSERLRGHATAGRATGPAPPQPR